MDADSAAAVRQVLHGKRVVHFGGGVVVDGKGGDAFGLRQVGGVGNGRCGALSREMPQFEAVEQVLRQGSDAACLLRQFVKREFQAVGGFGKGFVGQRLFVRHVEDGRQVGGDFGRQFPVFQTACPFLHQGFLLFFALDGGQCLFQGFFRRGFEDAFGFFVEVHRRGVEGDQCRGEFGFGRGVSEIFFGGGGDGEFFFAAGFPQQVGVDFGGFVLRFFEKGGHVAVKLGKNVGGFDFGALAVPGVGLIGRVVFLDDGGYFELAGFFVKYVHGRGRALKRDKGRLKRFFRRPGKWAALSRQTVFSSVRGVPALQRTGWRSGVPAGV